MVFLKWWVWWWNSNSRSKRIVKFNVWYDVWCWNGLNEWYVGCVFGYVFSEKEKM